MSRRTLLLIPLLCSFVLALLVSVGTSATQGPPAKTRGTVQINSSSEFNEKAHWAGGPIELCVPVYACPPVGGAVGVMICITIETGTKTPAEIASALAAAINGNAVCAGGGVSAKAVNDSVLITGTGGCWPVVTNGTPNAPEYTGATTGSPPKPNYNRLSATYFARN